MAALLCTEEEACDRMEHRFTFVDEEATEFVQSVHAEKCVGKGDDKVLESFTKEAGTAGSVNEQFARHLRTVRTRLREARGVPHRAPVRFKGDKAVSVEEAKALVPEGYGIYRIEDDGRWRARLARKDLEWSRSKSWGPSGEEVVALRFVLQKCWERHSLLTGEKCWVLDLFEPGNSPEAGPNAPAAAAASGSVSTSSSTGTAAASSGSGAPLVAGRKRQRRPPAAAAASGSAAPRVAGGFMPNPNTGTGDNVPLLVRVPSAGSGTAQSPSDGAGSAVGKATSGVKRIRSPANAVPKGPVHTKGKAAPKSLSPK
jgi:hypothetical protein